MHFLKQLIAALATPLAVAFLIGVAAGVCRAFRRRRMAVWLFATAAAIAYLGSISPVGNALIAPLESQYPPLNEDEPFLYGIRHIVVLGSGYAPRDGIPITAALEEDGLARIVEGVRLARRFTAARLVLSGGAQPGRTPSALGYAKLARSLGVDDASLVMLNGSLDTNAEAHSVAALLAGTPFILVTSAYHMPRAVRLMERAGLHPIPAPTGQTVQDSTRSSWRRLLPTSVALRKTERALHEYLGLAALAASRLVGWLQEHTLLSTPLAIPVHSRPDRLDVTRLEPLNGD